MSYAKPFYGFHTRFSDHASVDGLLRLVKEGLAPLGINHLILEFNPGYAYRCFPEYSTGTVTYEDCVRIRDVCAECGVKALPLFQCLSHQSDHMVGAKPWPIYKAHPELCETPDVPDDAKWPDFYVHSWCASNDEVYKYIFPMMDELIAAFDTDLLHVGLDEVFEIGEECCPRCQGKDKAALFARTVKILRDHLKEKGVEMMMWGDRLLNADKLGYQMWEADRFGMYPAFDRTDEVTRDIIITDWHYDLHDHGYPSVGQFMEGGFRTIAAFGSNEEQAAHFAKHCLEYIYLGNKFHWKGSFDGFLFTQWRPLTNESAEEILRGIQGAPRSEQPFTPVNTGRTIAMGMKELAPKLNGAKKG